MKISTVFENGEMIPSEYTCDGENISPEILIEDLPEEAESLVIIMDDPDIPAEVTEKIGISVYDHWVLYNVRPVERIEKNAELGVKGKNSSGELGYTGPCPPPQYEPKRHRYFLRVYALDTDLDLEEGATKTEVLEAMEGNVVEEAEIMGFYER